MEDLVSLYAVSTMWYSLVKRINFFPLFFQHHRQRTLSTNSIFTSKQTKVAYLIWLVAVQLGLDDELQPVIAFGTFLQVRRTQSDIMEFTELHYQRPLPSRVTACPGWDLKSFRCNKLVFIPDVNNVQSHHMAWDPLLANGHTSTSVDFTTD